MMLLTISLRTALSYIAVQTFPALLSRQTSLQKTSVSERSVSTLLLGLKVILEIRAIIII